MNKKNNNSLNIIYKKDARKILNFVDPEIEIQSTITSPPYFDMKDYQSENQVGFGQTYEEYLADLQAIFDGVYKITKEDGSLWIVIDTFKRGNQVVTLPFDLSDKMKEIGWLLQDVIIWKKDKTVPWSSSGFMQRKFEYILYFSKSKKVKSNKDQVRVYDTSQLKKWWVKYPERYNPKGKALDEVWEFPIPTQGSWGDKYIRHFCPLPKDMVATMIQISTDEDDVVLDPFAGSGTVLAQSGYMKRQFIGFELNKDYIKMFEKYYSKTLEANRREYELYKEKDGQDWFEETIINLRALKFARVLLKGIQKELGSEDVKIYVANVEKTKVTNKLVKVLYTIIGKVDQELYSGVIESLISKKPLSKFGIEPIIKFSETENFEEGDYGYSLTNTYSHLKDVGLHTKRVKVISKIKMDLCETDYI